MKSGSQLLENRFFFGLKGNDTPHLGHGMKFSHAARFSFLKASCTRATDFQVFRKASCSSVTDFPVFQKSSNSSATDFRVFPKTSNTRVTDFREMI